MNKNKKIMPSIYIFKNLKARGIYNLEYKFNLKPFELKKYEEILLDHDFIYKNEKNFYYAINHELFHAKTSPIFLFFISDYLIKLFLILSLYINSLGYILFLFLDFKNSNYDLLAIIIMSIFMLQLNLKCINEIIATIYGNFYKNKKRIRW